jgi:NAD(P)-dependent dehydrogenase (short-subunit alcohol dehydrogenase family)
MPDRKTAIITGAVGGIGSGLVEGVESLTARQPLKTVTQVKNIVNAVFYLARAPQITGEIIHVDGGSHASR